MGRTLPRLAFTAILLMARPATAEAWEVKTGLGPSFGTEFAGDRKDGFGAQAFLDVGINDLVSLTAGGGYVRHFLGSGESYHLINAGAGLIMNLDVVFFGVSLSLVPYAAVRLGMLQQRFDDAGVETGLGIAIALGFDYFYHEHYGVGLAFEYQSMLTDFDAFPAYLGISCRFGFRWLDW